MIVQLLHISILFHLWVCDFVHDFSQVLPGIPSTPPQTASQVISCS